MAGTDKCEHDGGWVDGHGDRWCGQCGKHLGTGAGVWGGRL